MQNGWQTLDSVLFNYCLIRRCSLTIQMCTETEVEKVLKNDSWKFRWLSYRHLLHGSMGVVCMVVWMFILKCPGMKSGAFRFFQQTTCRNSFREFLTFLRFALRSTRSVRLQYDKFSLISKVGNAFISNSIACDNPGANITVDEHLFPTKARCRFTQYIASKPDKFGRKFWLAEDVETKYIVNDLLYLGKD